MTKTFWQSAFDRLDALSRTRALTEQESIYLENAIDRLKYPHKPNPAMVNRYATLEADRHNLELADVLGRRKSRRIKEARWALWKRLADDGYSYASIGRATGHHHSSVLNGLGRL